MTAEQAAIKIGKAALRSDRKGDEFVFYLVSDVRDLMGSGYELSFDEAKSFETMLACVMYVQGLKNGR